MSPSPSPRDPFGAFHDAVAALAAVALRRVSPCETVLAARL